MKQAAGIIIVTGASGRIGDAVRRRFAGRFDEVVGFDRKAPQPAAPGCVYVAVDITSDESVREGLRTISDHHGSYVASVIHLAAYYDFFGKPSSKYEEITVQGTGRLLRELRAQDFRVEQLVFSSTLGASSHPSARHGRNTLHRRFRITPPGATGPRRPGA